MNETLELKIALQKEAELAHIALNCRSTVALSMGTGKSMVAINRIEAKLKTNKKAKILFCGARELYLENFKVELKKFKHQSWIPKITFTCIQSLHKYTHISYDLIIVDESHLLVKSYITFLEKQYKANPSIELLCLTGTPIQKNKRLNNLVPISIHKTIDHSIDNDLLNDYEIKVIKHSLDTNKNIHVKTDRYNFFTSEEASYKRLVSKYYSASYNEEGDWISGGFNKEGQYLKTFFKNSEAKKKIVLDLLKKHAEDKVLIYAGSIPQADSFKLPVYHSKIQKDIRQKTYSQFCKIDKGILVNVDGIKESVTIPKLNIAIIMHCGSNPSGLAQMLGRVSRLIPKEETALVYILVYKDTIEEDWFEKASKELKQHKITETCV